VDGIKSKNNFGKLGNEDSSFLSPSQEREQMIYIFDIDGTLADISHRLHFIQKEPKDWRGFFAACVDDVPIPEIVYLVDQLASCGNDIVMVTGRSDEVRAQTQMWLAGHEIPCDGLYMRKASDHREDHIIKGELLDEVKAWLQTRRLPDSMTQILGVFEDRKQVVDMYRSKGLRVFQVAEGDF
jgi:phosphoglycolate phosphatase-like HAD superfamily hydrolase